jgi:hypothetical protein
LKNGSPDNEAVWPPAARSVLLVLVPGWWIACQNSAWNPAHYGIVARLLRQEIQGLTLTHGLTQGRQGNGLETAPGEVRFCVPCTVKRTRSINTHMRAGRWGRARGSPWWDPRRGVVPYGSHNPPPRPANTPYPGGPSGRARGTARMADPLTPPGTEPSSELAMRARGTAMRLISRAYWPGA